MAVPALRDRGDMVDLRRRAAAASAACHLNLAAVALKARAGVAHSTELYAVKRLTPTLRPARVRAEQGVRGGA